jgi:hypothetical protein
MSYGQYVALTEGRGRTWVRSSLKRCSLKDSSRMLRKSRSRVMETKQSLSWTTEKKILRSN